MLKHVPLVLSFLILGHHHAIAQERIVVEIFLATEHVPAGLKAGATVDVKRVDGKSVTPAGIVSYTTSTLVSNIVVASITPVEHPKSPELAIKVELRVTKAQAVTIERTKTLLVRVSETTPDGGVKTVKKPAPFRLELSK